MSCALQTWIALIGLFCLACQNGMPPKAAPAAEAPPRMTTPPSSAFQERSQERQALVEALAGQGIHDASVLSAMRKVPRHAFVLPEARELAYHERPLPIVGGQTISEPYMVAYMTEATRPTRTANCLEIGTGSGYQAAVLAELCKHVYSIEYLAEVARFGEQNLRGQGYASDRVSLRVGDGYQGWSQAAPFDVIIVTAAPDHVPVPLLHQLAPGGRLIIPVGARDRVQQLERWTRTGTGDERGAFRIETLLPVRFVPFLGERVNR